MSDTSLTGAIDTGRLSRVADAPVTVTVSRTPLPGCDAAFERWTDRAIAVLADFPGSLGVGVLRPGGAGGEWHLVFRFVDGLALRNWDRSPQRAVLLAEVDRIATAMKVRRTVGVNNWFDLPDRATPHTRLANRVVLDAIWVYPVSLGLAIVVSPLLSGMVLWLRVLLSGLAVALLSQVLVRPVRTRLRRRRQFG